MPEPTNTVIHTGRFVYTISHGKLALEYRLDDRDLDEGVKSELMLAVWNAISDGRKYVVSAGMQTRDRVGVVEHDYQVKVLLLDPADAQVGEYVLRRPGDLCPNFINGVPPSRWEMGPDYWVRTE